MSCRSFKPFRRKSEICELRFLNGLKAAAPDVFRFRFIAMIEDIFQFVFARRLAGGTVATLAT